MVPGQARVVPGQARVVFLWHTERDRDYCGIVSPGYLIV